MMAHSPDSSKPTASVTRDPQGGKPKVVLHIQSSGGFYGMERLVSELTSLQIRNPAMKTYYMAFLDHDQVTSETADRLEAQGVETIRFRSKPRLDVRALFAYGRKLRELGVDMVHSHSYKTTFVHLASRLLGRHGVPLCITLHGYTRSTGDFRSACYERMDMFLMAFAKKVVCVSASDREYVERHNPRVAVEVIPNGINTDIVLKDEHPLRSLLPPEARDLPILGTVGRLAQVKNQELLLRGHARIRSQMPCKLVLIGDGPLRERLQSLAAGLDSLADVIFVPFQSNILEWMRDMDAFALTSHTEGLPMTLLEAGMVGKAVICSRVGAIPEVVTHGVNGMLFPTGDFQAFADSAARVLKDREFAARLGQALRDRVRDHYSIAATHRGYLRVYGQVMGRELPEA